MIMTNYPFERCVHFLSEQRTDRNRKFLTGKASQAASITTHPYQEYGEGVAQLKNVQCAKSTLQRQALLGLGRCGG